MTENGLNTFAMHGDDAHFRSTIDAINVELEAPTADAQGVSVEAVDPETAARRYVAAFMSNPDTPTLPAGTTAEAIEYQVLGTETVPLTDTKVVKFAEYYRRIPVYGSLVTVELDADNALLAIHTDLGEPANVDPVATVSPAQALAAIGDAATTDEAPKLYYYFDNQAQPQRWRLVYIATDVPNAARSEASLHTPDLALLRCPQVEAAGRPAAPRRAPRVARPTTYM